MFLSDIMSYLRKNKCQVPLCYLKENQMLNIKY